MKPTPEILRENLSLVIEGKKDTVLDCPYRSPMKIVEVIYPYVKDKVFCELGCACGDILLAVSSSARRVIGIENHPPYIEICKQRGGFEFYPSSFRNINLPEAEIYFTWWSNSKGVSEIVKDRPIIYSADSSVSHEVNQLESLSDSIIEVPYNEGDGFRQSGIFLLGLKNV